MNKGAGQHDKQSVAVKVVVKHYPELIQADIQSSARAAKMDSVQTPFRFAVPANDGAPAVALDSEQVVRNRRLGTLANRITRPVAEYQGVALRIIPGETEADDRVAVLLAHPERALDVSLFEAVDDTDVIAEWRLWSSTLGLPLLIEGLDGALIAAEKRLGAVDIARPRPRRRHALLNGRRPRFLTRRRTGTLPIVPLVHRDEDEIFARS
jgi:hypothetical protein